MFKAQTRKEKDIILGKDKEECKGSASESDCSTSTGSSSTTSVAPEMLGQTHGDSNDGLKAAETPALVHP